MQTSIATVSLSGGLAEKLEAIAAAGFTGVEIFESDLLSFNGTPADARRKALTIRSMLAWARTQGTPLRTLSVVAALAPAATFVDPA